MQIFFFLIIGHHLQVAQTTKLFLVCWNNLIEVPPVSSKLGSICRLWGQKALGYECQSRNTCVHASCFSRVRLFATPWTAAHQAPLSMGFSRQEYWSGLPCPSPGDFSGPGTEPVSPAAPALQADSLPLSHQGSPRADVTSLLKGPRASYVALLSLWLKQESAHRRWQTASKRLTLPPYLGLEHDETTTFETKSPVSYWGHFPIGVIAKR